MGKSVFCYVGAVVKMPRSVEGIGVGDEDEKSQKQNGKGVAAKNGGDKARSVSKDIHFI